MRFNTLWRSAIACAAITFASACGSSDSTGPEFDGNVTTDMAEGAGEASFFLAYEMMYSLYSMELGPSAEAVRAKVIAQLDAERPAPVGEGKWRLALDASKMFAAAMPLSGPRPMLAPGCSQTESGASEPGEPYDGNLNGFPDDYHFHMVCEFSEEGGGDTVLTAREVIDAVLRERPQDLVGFEVRVNGSTRTEDNHGNFQEQMQKTELLLSIRSDHATHHELSLQSIRSHLPGATETSVMEQGQRGDADYDPFSPIVLGDPIPDGKLTLDGRIHGINTDDDIAIQFLLDTPTPLEFDNSCADAEDQPFVDGVLRGRLNGNGSIGFTITFNSCGDSPDFETFGTDDDVPVAPKFLVRPFHP